VVFKDGKRHGEEKGYYDSPESSINYILNWKKGTKNGKEIQYY